MNTKENYELIFKIKEFFYQHLIQKDGRVVGKSLSYIFSKFPEFEKYVKAFFNQKTENFFQNLKLSHIKYIIDNIDNKTINEILLELTCPFCENLKEHKSKEQFYLTCKNHKDKRKELQRQILKTHQSEKMQNKKYKKELFEKIKQTNIKKYGTDNPMKNKQIKEKAKLTFIKNYGVDNPMKVNEIKIKKELNYIKKTGVRNPLQNEKIKEKIKKNIKELYQVENLSQLKEIKEKISLAKKNKRFERLVLSHDNLFKFVSKMKKELNKIKKIIKLKNKNINTEDIVKNFLNPWIEIFPDLNYYNYNDCIFLIEKFLEDPEKYNLNNLRCESNILNIKCSKFKMIKNKHLYLTCEDHNTKEITDKLRIVKAQEQTFQKYGVKTYLENLISREKIKNYYQTNFNCINPMQISEYKTKQQESLFKNYNVWYPMQAKEIKMKVISTNLKKYGVIWPTQNKEIQEKIIQTNLQKFQAENPMQLSEFKEKAYKSKRAQILFKVSQKFEKKYSDVKNLEKLNKDFIEQYFLNKDKTFKLNEFKEFYGYDSNSQPYKILKKLNVDYVKYKGTSQYESEIIEFIKKHYSGEIIKNDRTIIAPKELDIYIPEHNLAIEFDGLFWHSYGKTFIDEKQLDLKFQKYRHLEKTEACEEKNIHLFHIFENEWADPIKREIWKSKILYKLKKLHKKFYARKLEVRVLEKNQKNNKLIKEFFEKNHLQGHAVYSKAIGLFDNERLISCMTFGKPRYNKNFEYELIRFASLKNYNCIGCASKLFKHFVSKFNPKSIVSYANRRWAKSNTNIYQTLGFKFIEKSEPNYFYFKNDIFKLYHRSQFQKFKLKEHKDTKAFFNNDLTETEIMFNSGYRRIYDCGQLVYHWLREEVK